MTDSTSGNSGGNSSSGRGESERMAASSLSLVRDASRKRARAEDPSQPPPASPLPSTLASASASACLDYRLKVHESLSKFVRATREADAHAVEAVIRQAIQRGEPEEQADMEREEKKAPSSERRANTAERGRSSSSSVERPTKQSRLTQSVERTSHVASSSGSCNSNNNRSSSEADSHALQVQPAAHGLASEEASQTAALLKGQPPIAQAA